MLFSIFKKFLKTSYSFEGRGASEKTLVLLYQHWFVLILDLLSFFLMIFLPFILYFLVNEQLARFGWHDVFWFLVGIYFIFWWLGIFYRITMYLLNTWVVTDHRILNNEQHSFFSRTLSEMNLGKIQDVSVRLQGVVPTFLNFGDLEIQTAGAEPRFTFKQISNPQRVKELIMQAHNKFVYEHQSGPETHKNIEP